MSVNGIERFKEAMKGFEECYVLIGGSACDLLLAQYGERFRATKDLDIVVLTDSVNHEFSKALWAFINAGGYEPWKSKNGSLHFYRFVNPRTPGYPHMIELFARHPDFVLFDKDSEIAPLPLDDDISSLSAILLDDDYYAFLLKGLRVVDGVSMPDEAHLIVLKMRAHVDLNDRAAAGQHVNSADLKKHRKDALRLLEYVPNDAVLELSARMRIDARRFIATVEDQSFRIDQLGLSMSREEAVESLLRLCGIAS